MAENSNIEWCDHTFNPWIGCTKVSAGCKHCYAETLMDKRYGRVEWGVQGKRVRTSAANWKKPLAWNRKAEKEGRRYRVFCASLADVFEDKPDQREELRAWRKDLFDLIESTPNLDWLLLTKRPELVNDTIVDLNIVELPENIWIGTSVENQEAADERIPHLLKIPARVRFLSIEPLLGAVDLLGISTTHWRGAELISCLTGKLYDIWGQYVGATGERVHWVIVGGESGRNARPMHMEWVGDIVEQCKRSSIPVFVKQMGDNPFYDGESIKRHLGKKGSDMSKWHTHLQIREVPNA